MNMVKKEPLPTGYCISKHCSDVQDHVLADVMFETSAFCLVTKLTVYKVNHDRAFAQVLKC